MCSPLSPFEGMRETREGRTRGSGHSGERERGRDGDGTTWELRLKRGREGDLISLVSSREGKRMEERERGEGAGSTLDIREESLSNSSSLLNQRRRTDQISRHSLERERERTVNGREMGMNGRGRGRVDTKKRLSEGWTDSKEEEKGARSKGMERMERKEYQWMEGRRRMSKKSYDEYRM